MKLSPRHNYHKGQAFFVIVKTDCETDGALHSTNFEFGLMYLQKYLQKINPTAELVTNNGGNIEDVHIFIPSTCNFFPENHHQIVYQRLVIIRDFS